MAVLLASGSASASNAALRSFRSLDSWRFHVGGGVRASPPPSSTVTLTPQLCLLPVVNVSLYDHIPSSYAQHLQWPWLVGLCC